MDTLGWLIAVFLLVIFGKHFSMQASASIPDPSDPNVIQNSLPTPDGLPMTSNQNQNALNTQNAPAPWKSYPCADPGSSPLVPSGIALTSGGSTALHTNTVNPVAMRLTQ